MQLWDQFETVSCYGGVGPLWTGVCSCARQYVKVLLSAGRGYNNIHKIFMHIHKCTLGGGGGGNSITASGHRNLSPPPHEPLDVNPPPHLPRDDGALKQEGITDKIRAITLSISIDFFFYGLLFLYKHIFNRFTHEKRVQDCEQSERAPHRLENTACLGAKNGNV